MDYSKTTKFGLPRKTLRIPKRIRTQHGRLSIFSTIWGKQSSPQCDYGESQTVGHLERIVEKCPHRGNKITPEDFLIKTIKVLLLINLFIINLIN